MATKSPAGRTVTVTGNEQARKAYHTKECFHAKQIADPVEIPLDEVDVEPCNLCRGDFEKTPEGEVFVGSLYKNYHLYKCRNTKQSTTITTRNKICMERSRATLCKECQTIKESLE